MRTAKTLIRLGGCLGWSESSLGAEVVLLVWSYRRRLIYSAKIKSIQEIFSMLDWTRMKVHCCPMHVWKHGLSHYLAMWQGRPFWILCQWWMMWHSKHKRCSFLFSQIKISESECKKKCFHVNEIADWVNNISNRILMNQYLQNCSAAIASAKKVLNSDLSCSDSGYNGVSIGNSICYKCWTNTFPS